MFRKKKGDDQERSGTNSLTETSGLKESKSAKAAVTPRYPRLKIMLIDMKDQSEAVLKKEGYNITSGSFGVLYKVEKGDGYVPVIPNFNLPNFTEQEIIVIDLVPAKTLDGPSGEKLVPDGEIDWWAGCGLGLVDPRPRTMEMARSDFERIREHGGAFVIFADSRDKQKLVKAYMSEGYLQRVSNPLDYIPDNWSFLQVLNGYSLYAPYDSGEEISVEDEDHPLFRLLAERVEEAYFLCTLHLAKELKDRWITLAKNKYGAPVAGVIVPEEKGKGWILIFPQIKDKASFLSKLLRDVLPDLSPRLFPHLEGAKWVYRSEYEMPKVLEIRQRIHHLQEETRRQVVELEKAIEDERTSMAYLHDLLRETGEPLVASVKKTLEVLGFSSVVDVDEEMAKSGDSRAKREDLQVLDISPILLVEIKGISNLPKDSEALQVWKYIVPRMRELNATDIRGLSVINHQRHIPPLERENKSTFREEIIANAEEQGFALITTWDLFRLTRSFLKNGWKHDHVRPLFYQSGRIDPVPVHYEFTGVIEHFWERPGAVGIRIQSGSLKQGHHIAFDLPIEFEEQKVDSLQIDDQDTIEAASGTLVGIKTHLSKEHARKGVRVFKLS